VRVRRKRHRPVEQHDSPLVQEVPGASWAGLRPPIQGGGPGRVVKLDEDLIHGRRKYGRGRINTQVWVLGVIVGIGSIKQPIYRFQGLQDGV